MNCCDEYGDCRQGRDCPVRKERTEQLEQKLKLKPELNTRAVFENILNRTLKWFNLKN